MPKNGDQWKPGFVWQVIQGEPGCLSCNVYRDEQVNGVLVLEEVLRAEEDLENHLRLDKYLNTLGHGNGTETA